MKIKSILFALAILQASISFASPGPRHLALGKKLGQYKTEGFFAGGNKEVTTLNLKDVRRARADEGYERIVLDLESPAGIPYFQVQGSLSEGRIVISIWSDVQYEYDPAKISRAFSKSTNVKKVNVIPRVEDGLSIIELSLDQKKDSKFEAFYLTKPDRIIIDIL